MAYPSTADLVAASSVAALTDLTTEQQDALRAAAIRGVEGFTRQSFTQEGTLASPVEKVVDGSGTNRLWLPKRLASLEAVSVQGAALDAAGVELMANGWRLVIPEAGWASNYYERAMHAINRLDGARFTAGAGAVRVSGVWGWTDDEYEDSLSAVTEAILADMEDSAQGDASELADTVAAARRLGLSALSQGDVSLELGGRVGVLSLRAQNALLDAQLQRPASGGVAV